MATQIPRGGCGGGWGAMPKNTDSEVLMGHRSQEVKGRGGGGGTTPKNTDCFPQRY